MVGGLGIGALGTALARAGRAAGPQSGSGGAAGIGAVAGIVLLLPMEAGVPIPIPADLVMLAVGARVGAGDIPLWAAVLVLGAAAFWLVRRGRRAGAGSLAEAACPACLTLALLAERPAEVRAVAGLAPGPAAADPAPGPAPDRG